MSVVAFESCPLTSDRLYVTNLPSTKIQKADIRTALYMLFSTYGPVLDVVALKTMSMRGQAHIVYRDVQTSTQAMRHLNGQTFLGRPLVRAHCPELLPSFRGANPSRKSNTPSPSRTLYRSWMERSRSLAPRALPLQNRPNCRGAYLMLRRRDLLRPRAFPQSPRRLPITS